MKIIQIHKLIQLLVIALMITSCKTMYRANRVNTPVFKKKGELQAELVTGSGGIEVQSAYSLTSNISLMLNGVYDNSKVRVIDTLSGVRDGNSEYNNIFGEGAIGYYKTFGRDTSKMLAMYFGAGIGETKGYSDRWDKDFLKYNSRYTRLFWQPTYGVLVKRNFEVAAAVRFSFLNYHSLTIKDDIGTSYHSSSYDFFVDPVFSLKGGYDQFKFVVQLGASMPIIKQEYYSTSPLLLSFGFHLNFTRYWEREDDYFED